MYSETAEHYSIKNNPENFNKIYAEIADATPLKKSFRITSLIGKLPSIRFYSASSQSDIIRVVVRDMKTLPFDHDRLEKDRARYKWQFAQREPSKFNNSNLKG